MPFDRERRAIALRLFILVLCMGSVGAYGYALAGYAGGLWGRGRTDYIVWGLLLGTALAASALRLWKRWLAANTD
jgi:membrane protease YdiL (CAAX protease family)